MYAFLYLDVLHVHTAIVRRINICMALFGCIAYSYSNCKENKHVFGIWMYCMFMDNKFLYLDVLHVHTAIVRRINICMASFIWMYCIFIQQL